MRDAAGLTKEAFRHWRKVLPGFPSGNGHGPCFLPGDVLASAVLNQMIRGCGVRVGQLTEVSQEIFDVCNLTPWEELSEHVLVVELGSEARVTVAKRSHVLGDSTVVLCPMAPIIAKLSIDLIQPLPAAADQARKRAASYEYQLTVDGRDR